MAYDLIDSISVRGTRLEGYAIVVGINGYTNGITRLRTAVPDAVSVARALVKSPHHYRVHLVADDAGEVSRMVATLPREQATRITITTNASASDIWNAVKAVATAAPVDSALIFYFAGHGMSHMFKNRPEGFLLPADARCVNGELELLTCISMSKIHDYLSDVKSRHVLAILDCCFAGAVRWGADTLTRDVPTTLLHEHTYEQYVNGKARQVIVSAGADEKAVEYKRDGDPAMDGDGAAQLHSPSYAKNNNLWKSLMRSA
ncbi:hypothetical protein DB346_08055 [Verrucomicrobia bacterium LW23]|nr:hypothetical protein DB346_08055 [Verrucomicrobia bacterium LW23]